MNPALASMPMLFPLYHAAPPLWGSDVQQIHLYKPLHLYNAGLSYTSVRTTSAFDVSWGSLRS